MGEGSSEDLRGFVAIVTGGGQGIGAGIVHQLSQAGATVVVNDLVEERAAAVAAEVVDSGGQAAAVPADITNPEDVDRLVLTTSEMYGEIDLLVNNAGAFCNKPFMEHSIDEWDTVFRVNVRGPFLTCRTVLPAMIERRRGVIVNVSSISAYNTTRDHVAYAASKAAIITFTRDLAAEVAEFGIRVNAVAPGPIGQGKMLLEEKPHHGIILPYAGRTADIGHAVAFLASEKAKFITGETLPVAGGANLKVNR